MIGRGRQAAELMSACSCVLLQEKASSSGRTPSNNFLCMMRSGPAHLRKRGCAQGLCLAFSLHLAQLPLQLLLLLAGCHVSLLLPAGLLLGVLELHLRHRGTLTTLPRHHPLLILPVVLTYMYGGLMRLREGAGQDAAIHAVLCVIRQGASDGPPNAMYTQHQQCPRRSHAPA